MLRELRASLRMLLVLTLVTGFAYPLLVTGIAAVAFPHQAGGSLVGTPSGGIAGSALLGQSFADPKYFWSRPSATTVPYDASASTGSNLGPTNPALLDAIRSRVAALRAADPGNLALVPADLVTASASGLDPDLSPAAVDYQLARVARVRGLDAARLRDLVARCTEPRTFGVLGEPRVNALALNRALDALAVPGGRR